ncbi:MULTISPECIES: hypothetical protein [Gammaproteobacteria]|uniref:hypothetical protein n=1 Tax=Gammaproteobacteria TaxID=1236 RepID=UPI001ADB4D63|nr:MULTISPECIES: hypothetical protein [Gammaproteobacteria]MBO9482289.1 hypothetical protein [Salinisphaera sp. G21_0]MBO9494327.1 hypothetical protein [Thalassotalea sp. G20_0]
MAHHDELFALPGLQPIKPLATGTFSMGQLVGMLSTPSYYGAINIEGKKKSKISEPVGGKGEGTLVYKQQKSNVEAYYRYRDNNKDTLLFIGRYSRLGKTGLKLNEIRDKAREGTITLQ